MTWKSYWESKCFRNDFWCVLGWPRHTCCQMSVFWDDQNTCWQMGVFWDDQNTLAVVSARRNLTNDVVTCIGRTLKKRRTSNGGLQRADFKRWLLLSSICECAGYPSILCSICESLLVILVHLSSFPTPPSLECASYPSILVIQGYEPSRWAPPVSQFLDIRVIMCVSTFLIHDSLLT